MSRRILSWLCCALALLALSGCGRGAEAEGAEGISVVTTGFAAYDFARQLLGERGEAELLIPPGSETHSFEPTPKDIIDIQNCDLFIYTGGESEAWVADVLESVGGGVRAVTLMDCVELLEEETVEGMEDPHAGHDHGHGAEYDEHVWTSPRNAALICGKIAAALSEADPQGAESYAAALEDYCAQLDELDAACTEVVESGARRTVVFADRFPLLYFARAYGLEYFAAYPGCSDDAEPSAAPGAFLIDKVREAAIPVVFHIALSNALLADTVCDETGAEKRLFSACHNVTRAQFESGATYMELMWDNVDALREALS